MLMAPQASQKEIVTIPSSDVEVKTSKQRRSHHRRSQKLCTTQRLPALFAWLLLLTTSFTYWICVFPEILILLPQLLPIPILHCILFILACANFMLATFMDPGIYQQSSKNEYKNVSFYTRSSKRIGSNNNIVVEEEDDDDDSDEPQSRLIRIHDGSVYIKYCRTCKLFRPPRCSHCSICERCIDIFDHHCPWLNNCVGRRNYRYFFQFLSLLCIHMIFLFIFCLYYVLHDRHHQVRNPPTFLSVPSNGYPLKRQNEHAYINRTTFVGFSDYRFIVCIILLILLGLMAIPIGGLTGYHIYLISKGRTTNEQVTGKYRIQNDIFNRGCWKNICRALCQPLYPRLTSPQVKRFDVDLFEQMAYGKMTRKSTRNDEDTKKNMNYEANGKLDTLPNVHINPIDENVRHYNNPLHNAQSQSIASAVSGASSSSFQALQKPLLHETIKPAFDSIRRSLSNMSLSSRYSYDNIDGNEEDIQQALPYYPNNNNSSKQTKRIYTNLNSNQADNVSQNSAITLRTDSYRQAHPLQSFAFDYPKQPLLRQSVDADPQNRRKTNGNKKHYEISV